METRDLPSPDADDSERMQSASADPGPEPLHDPKPARPSPQPSGDPGRAMELVAAVLALPVVLVLIFWAASAIRTQPVPQSAISYGYSSQNGHISIRPGILSVPTPSPAPTPAAKPTAAPTPSGYYGTLIGGPAAVRGYIGNTGSHIFHRTTCSYLPAKSNQIRFETREEAIDAGYTPCSRCHP